MGENDKLTEDKIFEAATLVFEEEGMTGARMQNIADRAGINKALLHYYFRTKDHLFDAVFSKLALKMFKKFSPIFEENLTLEEKIRFFFREHINFLKQNPKLPGFILNEINRNPQRIKQLLGNLDFKKLWTAIIEHHSDELYKYNISEENLPQIMTTIASLSVFPFAARGIFEVIFSNVGVEFDKYIEERKEFAADFVIKAITK
jgi:AcrR family transcriptional regulator